MKYFFVLFFIVLYTSLSDEARLLRYPNTSETDIVFTYAGDLYTVPITGGTARKLTNSEGFEVYARFSPDGKQLAFSGEYDGNREIYLMPSTGGNPQRLTYSMDIPDVSERMGPDKIVMQWSKDGNNILYRSRKDSWNSFIGALYTISRQGGLPEQLPLPRGGFASYSPDGTKLAYNRIFREYRTWKRYRGGMADDIWIYDFNTKKIENITNNDAQDIIPMWHGSKIYFMSDRDKVMNIFVYDLNTKQTRKVTEFKDYDVKFASLGAKHISFENAGYIYLLDLETEKVNKVSINLEGDFPDARTTIRSVKDNITSFEIAPDAKRALFNARGDIFTVPAEKGNIRNLTKTPGVHDRNAVWAPDGKWIAFISDRSGEDEIYLMKGDGADVIQLTNNSKSYRYELEWSPDSKKLLCSDKTMRLYFIDIESKKETTVATSDYWEIRNYVWSPDSKWIAFTDISQNEFSVVKLFSTESGKLTQITDEFFNSNDPVFDPDGRYLFFVSNRRFEPELGNFEMSYQYNDMSGIFGVTLLDSIKTPFAFQSDEVKVAEDKKDEGDKKTEKKDKEKTEKDKSLQVNLTGIKDRLFDMQLPKGNYGGLAMVDGKKIYYIKSTQGKPPALFAYDLEKLKENQVGDFSSYEISADGKKILFRSGNDYFIEKLDESVKADKGKLNLTDMKVTLDRKAEWKQIFNECWRQMRDFFYDPGMHGVDWKAIHDKYAVLLESVEHRADLTYLIGEMIAELNIGHAYVGGGEAPKVEPLKIGLLGAEFELDKESGFYKITKIFPGRNWNNDTRSPLTEPGITIKPGEYLTAIDGVTLNTETHPYKLLIDKVNKFVSLSVNSKPVLAGSRVYEVKTIPDESGLRYFNWVERNRRYVDSVTGGKVAYVHIPDMGFEGLNEFVKYFYPQLKKEALIVDDRFNGGGFVSQMILERLRRVMTMVANARNQKAIGTYPDAVFTGPMVCMLNEFSASDGDIFPYNFKKNNLGKLIGKRSWGGVVGIRGSLPLLDGGYLFKPEFAHFSTDGKWILEGVGMEPDIVVDNDPAMEWSGKDQQLDKAIEVILDELKASAKPKVPTQVPEYPKKN
jgi:tricorn protease